MKRLCLLGCLLLVALGTPAMSAVVVDIELPPHHLGDRDIPNWPSLEGTSFSKSVYINLDALSDGIVYFDAYDVDSGYNTVYDRLLWDGELVEFLSPTPPQERLIWTSCELTLPQKYITSGWHTFSFESDQDSKGDWDDFCFQNVRLRYEPVPEPQSLLSIACGLSWLVWRKKVAQPEG